MAAGKLAAAAEAPSVAISEANDDATGAVAIARAGTLAWADSGPTAAAAAAAAAAVGLVVVVVVPDWA